METPFKRGDKVYCVIEGHGTVVDVNINSKYGIDVQFNQRHNDKYGYIRSYTLDGRLYLDAQHTLSFTEYTLQGFSQEKPIEQHKKQGARVVGRHKKQVITEPTKKEFSLFWGLIKIKY